MTIDHRSFAVQFVRAGSRSAQGQSKVYVCPQELAALGIAAGTPIVLYVKTREGGRQLVFCGIVWPMDSLKRQQLAISRVWEAHCAQFGQVAIQTLQEASRSWIAKRIATHVTLRSVGSIQLSETERKRLQQCIQVMLDGVMIHTDARISIPLRGREKVFSVDSVSGVHDSTDTRQSIYRVDTKTSLSVEYNPEIVLDEQNSEPTKASGLKAVGGLHKEIDTIRQILEQPLTNPEVFAQYALPPPKGVLLFGPPGTGKTLIARSLASELQAEIFLVNGPELVSKYVGESEANLRRVFTQAAQKAPSLVFIDEIDALCPKRDARVGEMEKRLVATLLTLLDGLQQASGVVVLAATNRPNALDPAVRRPGRFDREVEIAVPNADDRKEVLRILLDRIPHSISSEGLNKLSNDAHGFVGADLEALCKEAALLALHRSSAGMDDPIEAEEKSFIVEEADLKKAMIGIQPSALREIAVSVPHVLWKDIGGQSFLKQQLKEAVEWPLQHPEAFVRMGIRPPKGVLLYGPPGCSKTLTAKALATESSMNFVAVKGPELFSKWVGESERTVRELFRKARSAAPTVVFFDEIDAIASQRGSSGSSQVADRVLSQLLTELDGIQPLKQVLVVAATNRPDLIDDALMRPGRIDRVLYVGPPDEEARREILSIHCKKMPLAKDVDMNQVAMKTNLYSGAELYAVCREAAMAAMEEDPENANEVAARHFEAAIGNVQPQIDDKMLQFFNNFRSQSHRR